MRTHHLLPYVIVITAGACGGGGGGSVSLQDVPERFEEAVCQNAVACGSAPDLATCRATTFFDDGDVAELQAAIDRGTVTYDGDAAGACIDALTDSSCTWSDAFSGDGEAPDVCANAVRGSVAAGGACLIDEECVGGSAGEAECVPADACTMACCMGTCVAEGDGGVTPIAEGQPCDAFGEVPCDDGLYCKRTSPDADTGTCTAQVTSGACDEFDACAPPLFCNIDFATGMGECYRPAAEGATCDPEVFLAACDRFDNYCDAADTTCKKRKAPGEPCDIEIDNCVEYAWCNGGTCAAFPGEGQPCSGPQGDDCLGDLDCESSGTGSGTCRAPTPDAPCTGT
jgi:hypothetical protein